MKKFTKVLFWVLTAVVLATTAMAATVNYETDEYAAFDVTYTGTAGEYYAIVVVEGIAAKGETPNITETSIQYIDQKTAGTSGTVVFEDVVLKDDGTPCSVYLGGSDLDEAVLLGYVNNVNAPGEFYVVTGKTNAGATVTITDTNNAAVTFTETATSGNYTFAEIPAGTYKLVVTMAKHTSYTKNELVVADNVTYKDVSLKGGDVSADGAIGFSDLLTILTNYNTTNASADITGDGTVGFSDMLVVLTNYNLTSVME